jgi:integrase
MTPNHNFALVPRNAAGWSTKILPYLPPEEIALLEIAAARAPRKGKRDSLELF